MHIKVASTLIGVFIAVDASALPKVPGWWRTKSWTNPIHHHFENTKLGPRPEYLVTDMDEGWLKDRLSACSDREARPTKFSTGRGAARVCSFPRRRESQLRRAREWALVSWNATSSLLVIVSLFAAMTSVTYTNIVATELGAKCTRPFTPASISTLATAYCCTSDITLAEFKSLCGKMDGFNASATTPEHFLHGTPAWRTDLYATRGTTLAAELKQPRVPMPFGGNYTQELYAQQVVEEYRAAAAGDYYYSTIANGTHRDGDMYRLVDVLARQVGVECIFSDWSATVTYYANCCGLF
ncbi:hypothetical protein F4776DRAFT_669182 [Hypoxylon sp. NC0597]|nr:hypothetical protein F4776DRAFT_669182 [Hypoxylon sp. NC0597]